MESPRYTISDIRSAVATAASKQGEFSLTEERQGRPGLRHIVQVAKRRAKELSKDYWQVQESLQPQIPTTYDREHTAAVFDELHEMTREHKPTRFYGITPDIVREAEQILFSGLVDTTRALPIPYETNQLQDDRTPYLIRGHHLWFAWRVTEGHGADQIASDLNNHYLRRQIGDRRYTDEAIENTADIIGNTPAEAQKHKEDHRKIFQKLDDLPDDYPIELVTGMPDEICKGCIVGNHCKVKTSAIRKMSMIDHDREVLSVFVNEARELGITDGLTVIKKTATFSDAEPEEVEGIRTTVGIVKLILELSSVHWGEIYNVFPFESHILKNTTTK